MKHDFDTVANRRGTHCIKWDYLKEFFGKEDLNPLWVADMDFKAPEAILNPIIERASHGVFGYTAKPESFYRAVVNWFKRRYHWEIKRDWIVTTPGVVPALNLAIQTFTAPEDGVIIQPPVYFPFMDSVKLNGRKILNNQLTLQDGRYQIDFEDLAKKAERATMLILCSPHNPVARVWTLAELKKLGSICRDTGLIVFSDEIHADIVFSPFRHTPAAMVNDFLHGNSICAYATSKTFNLAGLQLSVNIIPDKGLRERFKLSLEKLHLGMSNIFGIVGTTAAYAHGEEWLDQLLPYLWNNYEAVNTFLDREVPEVSVLKPEGTFLLWLDCRGLGLTDEQLASLFVNKAGLALSNGAMFGPGGSGFMRMNIACPKQNLLDALENLKRAIEDDSPIPENTVCGDAPGDT